MSRLIAIGRRVVSNVLPAHQAAVLDCLHAIAKVHRIPETMPTIPIETDLSLTGQAAYFFDSGTHDPVRITLSGRVTLPAVALTHELGHFIDHQGIAGPRFEPITIAATDWAALPNDVRHALETWETAVHGSEAYGRLRDLRANPYVSVAGRTEDVSVLVPFLEYLLETHELFARSYAQYIAHKSVNVRLAGELEGMLEDQRNEVIYVPEQWEQDDFVPLMEAFDLLLGALRWLR
ncbi:MAG: hypothetical protein JXA57_16255 [Armatimonadetes bacterium]|nr:hypothetical protein [Armatimonadota bacterium]